MIPRLRRRMSLLVIGVLVIVTAGIIFAISYANFRSVDMRAYTTLRVLAGNEGVRPGLPGPYPGDAAGDSAPGEPVPEGTVPEGTPPPMPLMDQPDVSMAGLSNFYTVSLDSDGNILGWESDRKELYTDDQVEGVTASALKTGRETGKVGTQYFRLMDSGDGKRLIVLDARLEHMAAYSVLRTTALVAALACALLSAAAWLLIGQMVKPVQEAFERQKQFVWDASHEFKTPLAVISANAEVLAGDIGENEYLGYIRSEVQRTDRLVQNLLTLARMDKGTVTAQMERVDISKALLGVALPFESTVFESGRTLETDIPEGVFARGDPEMLQQLAVILLSNALKYSNEGGLIKLSLQQKGRGCQFSVYNTGPGIAPENLNRIFDRFYREDLSHNSEIAGNGLGLAIARNIVDAHKGTIHAESEYGKDAVFIVNIP